MNSINDRGERLLVITTLYKDHKEALGMMETLGRCNTPGMDPWVGLTRFMFIDASPEPDPRFSECENTAVRYVHLKKPLPLRGNLPFQASLHRPSLSEALNHGFHYAFEHKFDYVAWVHPDMDFSVDPGWITHCISALERNSVYGKVSPHECHTVEEAEHYKDTWMEDGRGNAEPRKGNACPWMVRVEDASHIADQMGGVSREVFNTKYELLQFEDWDFINRMAVACGKASVILPLSVVVHEGMGTRKNHDYGDSIRWNRNLYESIWGLVGSHM